jgi:hypothetical protein
MKLLGRQTKPAGGYSALLHILFTAVLPLMMYVFVQVGFVAFAFMVVLLSKWRMFAVKMRHWPANIRANAVDIFVGLSMVSFISIAKGTLMIQLGWVLFYTVWLLFIKPQSTQFWVGMQALIAQSLTLAAVYLVWSESSDAVLTFVVWGITYLCARHFLNAFDEAMSRATAYVWAFFCACLAWVTSHWLLYYSVVAQPVLIITVIGYGLGSMYYLDHIEKLKPTVRRQFVTVIVTIILFMLIFSDWSGDII